MHMDRSIYVERTVRTDSTQIGSRMIIRRVRKGDNKLLADLIKQAFDEHGAPIEGTVYSDPTTDDLYGLFQTDRSILWVAEEHGEVLGCCGIYPTRGLPDRCAELVKFYLLPKARGRGIGSKLMERNIDSARKLGYTELYLESVPEFDKAVRMYGKFGFKHLVKPLGESGHTACNIRMIKKLVEE